jgi:hypothetical protein
MREGSQQFYIGRGQTRIASVTAGDGAEKDKEDSSRFHETILREQG